MKFKDNNTGKSELTVIVISLVFLITMICINCMSSCSDQGRAKNWGGTMDLELEPNDKLIEVTWKGDQLWILTKAMKEDDIADEYKFYEKSTLGILEGCINIKEKKLSDEEYKAYKESKQLEEDFNKDGNYQQVDGEWQVVYIKYNAETDTYEKIKDYTYGENGQLVDK